MVADRMIMQLMVLILCLALLLLLVVAKADITETMVLMVDQVEAVAV